MQHPLKNPSLTPHGFGAGNTFGRTKLKTFGHGTFNGDWGAARYWERSNRLSSDYRPAEHIIHTLMPGMRTPGRTYAGDFEFAGRPYQVHDLSVLTAAAVWLGTNCGQAMFSRSPLTSPAHFSSTNEFRVRWHQYGDSEKKGYLLSHLLHECQPHSCDFGRQQSCSVFHRPATEREELVLDALLFWLESLRGREYLLGLKSFLNSTAKNLAAAQRRVGQAEPVRQPG